MNSMKSLRRCNNERPASPVNGEASSTVGRRPIKIRTIPFAPFEFIVENSTQGFVLCWSFIFSEIRSVFQTFTEEKQILVPLPEPVYTIL